MSVESQHAEWLAVLEDLEFPACGLRHEKIRKELRDSGALLPIISTRVYEDFCPFEDRARRPSCPHFADMPSSDPLVRAMAFLNRGGLDFRSRHSEYREWRSLLIYIDHAIRDVRKSMHLLATGKLLVPECEACAGALRTAQRLALLGTPAEWNGIGTLAELEAALLSRHEQIREGMMKLTDDVMTATRELTEKG